MIYNNHSRINNYSAVLRLSLFIALVLLISITLIASGCNKYPLESPSAIEYDEDNGNISWNKVNLALKYEVIITDMDGNPIGQPIVTTETSINLDALGIGGEILVKVKAIGDGRVLTSSSFSDPISVLHVIQLGNLEAMQLSVVGDNLKLSFINSYGAERYVFEFLSEEQEVLATDEILAILNIIEVSFPISVMGNYTIRYQVFGISEYFIDSGELEIECAVTPLSIPNNSKNYDIKNNNDINITYESELLTITSIKLGVASLVNNQDYTVNTENKTITFKKEFLSNLALGNNVITVYTAFNSVEVNITISDTRPLSIMTPIVNVPEGGDSAIVVELIAYNYDVIGLSIEQIMLANTLFQYDIGHMRLTIGASVYKERAIGQYSLTIVTENGNIPFTLNILKSDAPYLSHSELTYVKGSFTNIIFTSHNISTANFFSNNNRIINDDLNILDANFRNGSGYVYGTQGSLTTFTLSASYLNTLSEGEYNFAVHNRISTLPFKVRIIDNNKSPSNVRIDFMENGNGVAVVRWDYPISTNFTVSSGSNSYATNNNYFPVSQLSSQDTFTVTVKETNAENSTTITLTKPNPVHSTINYSTKVYSYLSEMNNYFITSEDELAYLIEYAIFFRISSVTAMISIIDVTEQSHLSNVTTNAINQAKNRLGSLSNGASGSYSGVLSSMVITFNFSYNSINTAQGVFNYKESLIDSGYQNVPNDNRMQPCYANLTSSRNQHSMLSIDSVQETQMVSTSSQLYYAVEMGLRPICEEGSTAEYIYNKAREVLIEINDDSYTDYQKIHYIYDWLIFNVSYDYGVLVYYNDSSFNSNELWKFHCFYLEGVFGTSDYAGGVAVCDGIAKAFVLLSRMEGIEAVRAEGDAHGENHADRKSVV